jgi:head-tail adaptor
MDTRVRCRYSALTAVMTPKHRLVHQGSVFNIVSVAHVKLAQREVEVMCKSGVSDG